MASVTWNDTCQIVRLHHPSASPEAICWCGSGCLSVAGAGCTFLWKPQALSQSWSGSLHASFCRSKVFTSISEREHGWYESAPLSVNLLLSDSVCTLCSPLLWACLCLADVDKCLGLACLSRSLRDAQRRLSILLWLSLPNTESLKFLERFSQQRCEPTLNFRLFWLIQTKESTNWSIALLFSIQS